MVCGVHGGGLVLCGIVGEGDYGGTDSVDGGVELEGWGLYGGPVFWKRLCRGQ